jgi:PiT family inorganic phosphate transporter
MLILIILLAFYLAWNLGANDVANSMGTSVGSKVLTLKKALLVAGILEFSGAVFFGQNVSGTIATDIANSELFADRPQVLLLGMVAVLLAAGIWLQIATAAGLPVSSSHAVVGAIAGFSWVAGGAGAIDWQNIGQISLAWGVTPVISGIIAASFYYLLKTFILDRDRPLFYLEEWIPWLSAILLGVFGIIVFPNIFNHSWFGFVPLPSRGLSLLAGGTMAMVLTYTSWKSLARSSDREKETLILEKIIGRFQVVSACFVAFAHGSNDVGNAIAPLAAIVYILNTNTVPLDNLTVPYWILIVGGLGIVAGLAVQGKNVIGTVGEGIIPLQPSSGFSAEIATATTVLLASSLGLPVSTSHALIGSVVGIGLWQNWQKVRFSTIKSVILAWIVTIPLATIIGALNFVVLRWLFL